MKTIIRITLLAIIASNSFTSAQTITKIANEKGWNKLGEKTIDIKNDHSEINIGSSENYRAIKVKAKTATIYLDGIVIHFKNGNQQAIRLARYINVGNENYIFQLDKGEAEINKVTFDYKVVTNQANTKSNVEIWGIADDEIISKHTETLPPVIAAVN